jgi:hypothetical protein
MDFNTFDTSKKSDEGTWVDIISPDEVTIVAQFKILGRDSKKLKRRQQEIAKKREGKRKISSVEQEADTLETIATCTEAWRDVVDGKPVEDCTVIVDQGEKLECTFDNALAVYKKYNWIAEQVIENIQDRSNFL